MQGVTQSYCIYDSAQYQAAKIMIRLLDKEDYENYNSKRAARQAAREAGQKAPAKRRSTTEIRVTAKGAAK